MTNLLSMEDTFIAKLNTIIGEHLEDEQFGVEELAGFLGLSRSQLHRKLHTITSKSTSQYIREYRLEKAMQMLQDNVATASEIAYRVGFNSPTYFSTSFHQYFGYPPGEVKLRSSLNKNGKGKTGRLYKWLKSKQIQSNNYFVPKNILIGSLVLVVLVGLIYFSSLSSSRETVEENLPVKDSLHKTIAVLPFKSLSDNNENRYFAQGIREDIIAHLSGINEIIVKSRQSTEKYNDNVFTVSQISEDLGVNYVLDGSVQIHNERIKIRVSLIKTENDIQLWAKDFDREFKDIFTLESEISRQIASELDLVLSPTELQRIGKVPTNNLESYELLIKGRYFLLGDYGDPNIDLARKYFLQSITIDPNFALAYSFMAESYLWEHWPNPTIEAMVEAKGYALKAIALDKALSEPYSVLGWIYASYEWNWEKAEEAFELSISLNPNNIYALCRYSQYLQYTKGDFEYARALINRALLVAPFSFYANILSASYYFQQGDYNNALKASKNAEKIAPEDLWSYWINFEIYVRQGKPEMAVKELEESWSIQPNTRENIVPMLRAYNNNGIRGIYKWINELDINHATEERVIEFNVIWIAQKFAFLGKKELAMDWLEIAYKGKNGELFKAKYDPYFESLRNEPRFLDILQKMNLDGYIKDNINL